MFFNTFSSIQSSLPNESPCDEAITRAFPWSPLDLYHLDIICKANSNLISKPELDGNASKQQCLTLLPNTYHAWSYQNAFFLKISRFSKYLFFGFKFGGNSLILSNFSRFGFSGNHLISLGFRFGNNYLILSLFSELRFGSDRLNLSIFSRFRFGSGRLISSGFRFSSDRLILSIFYGFMFGGSHLISSGFKFDSDRLILSISSGFRFGNDHLILSSFSRFKFGSDCLISLGFRFGSDHLILHFPKLLSFKIALSSCFQYPKIFGHPTQPFMFS